MGPASESAQGTSSPRLLKPVSMSDLWLTERRGESQGAPAPSFSVQSRQLASLWLCWVLQGSSCFLDAGMRKGQTMKKIGGEAVLVAEHGISVDVSCEDVRYQEGPRCWLL